MDKTCLMWTCVGVVPFAAVGPHENQLTSEAVPMWHGAHVLVYDRRLLPQRRLLTWPLQQVQDRQRAMSSRHKHLEEGSTRSCSCRA